MLTVMKVNRDVTRREHPQALRPFLTEISDFAKHCHSVVLTILRWDSVTQRTCKGINAVRQAPRYWA